MSSFLFVFGRTPALSFIELFSIFPNVERISEEVAKVDISESEPDLFIKRLGGTVKIARLLGKIELLSPNFLIKFLETDRKPLIFGVSLYAKEIKLPRHFLKEMKKLLGEKGIVSNYVTSEENILSSVTVAKRHVLELILVEITDGFMVGTTVAIQPFEEWNKRDYDRPFVDPKAGMLPPKVARMVVNIASSGLQLMDDKFILLDPFCGMGTILAEALLSGWEVIGSDQSPEAVSKSEKNIHWLKKNYPETETKSASFFTSEATHVSDHLEEKSIDAIVTEPFMGATDQFGQSEKIKNTIKGLEKLYIGCLRDWHKILKPYGKVVMALPKYTLNKREYFVKKVIDSCENLGYTVDVGPIEYSRPQAKVRREFFVIKKLD